MSKSAHNAHQRRRSRRGFLKTSGAAVVSGALAGSLSVGRSAHAAGSDILRIGLIGCGGRGTGAAKQALTADKNTKLVAMGDAFADKVEGSLKSLEKTESVRDQLDVSQQCCFSGFDAYQQVIDSGVDVVLLCATPHFRPKHLQAAIDAGKHVFAEKPVAVDAQGVKKVLAACRQAKEKNLAVVSGLCWRYHFGARASIAQVHDGAVGEIVALQCSYNTAGRPKWPMKAREPGWSDMEWQMRNWYYFTWLSGGGIVEQAIHSLDKIAWVMHDVPPISAVGLGGNQCRREPDAGNIFDHHAIVYDYPGGIKLFFTCRQQPGTLGDVSSHIMGTNGICHVERPKVETRSGETLWRFEGPSNVMHQTEHDEFFAGLRSGHIINNGRYMAYSTMLPILGRMATYTGKKITWESAMNSTENLTPPEYKWGPLPTRDAAVPGVTPFV